jgi:hypothetical protein
MGFIFRTIFWLSAAVVILPPGSRLGGDNIAEFRDVDIEQELRAAAFSAWSIVSSASLACAENPELCQSATKLWNVSVSTVTDLISTEQAAWHQAQAEFDEMPHSRKNAREN